MSAWLNVPAPRGGTSRSAACQSRACVAAAFRSSGQARSRASTRWVFASTIGSGRSKANERIAPAMYRPTPGRARTRACSRGMTPPYVVDDHPRRGVQLPGAAVIAQPLPGLEHVCLLGHRQRLDIREPAEKPLEIGDHRGDRRLHQHHLGDEDPVGIGIGSPGELPMRFFIPCDQPGPDGTHPGLVQISRPGAGFLPRRPLDRRLLAVLSAVPGADCRP